MKVFTIGFTKTNARSFFGTLSASAVGRLIDVRLNNVSQLAGFAKRDDLAYFLEAICGMGYVHEPLLAPTQQMLDDFKKRGGDWAEYEKRFLGLMEERHIESTIPHELIDGSVLLCSEDKPHYCHRRLVAEFLAQRWENLQIIHLEPGQHSLASKLGSQSNAESAVHRWRSTGQR